MGVVVVVAVVDPDVVGRIGEDEPGRAGRDRPEGGEAVALDDLPVSRSNSPARRSAQSLISAAAFCASRLSSLCLR
jgi:hypothetical protein